MDGGRRHAGEMEYIELVEKHKTSCNESVNRSSRYSCNYV